MYLTPEKDGNAELTIGGYDDTKFTGTLCLSHPMLGGTRLTS
jgi:hypothetical protein